MNQSYEIRILRTNQKHLARLLLVATWVALAALVTATVALGLAIWAL